MSEGLALRADEFAAAMAQVGPFANDRAVVVGVSGGADSMALAWLLRRWGVPLAVVVDHGLRPGSAAEAELTAGRLVAMGVAVRVVRLAGLQGPNLGERAREARYAALLAVCQVEGLPDLLVAHHRQDQAETVALRAARGSRWAGMAGMPAVTYRAEARIIRPLLGVGKERLRATLLAAGVEWVEDPTNADVRTARGALRAGWLNVDGLCAQAGEAGRRRAVAEQEGTALLAGQVELFPGGHALVTGTLPGREAAALLAVVAGKIHAPSEQAAARVLVQGGTLHGAVVRRGEVVREEAGLAPPVPAYDGAVWDGRFATRRTIAGAMVGKLGVAAGALRFRPGPSAAAMRTSGAVWLGAELSSSPYKPYEAPFNGPSVMLDYRPPRPLAGAPFQPACGSERARG